MSSYFIGDCTGVDDFLSRKYGLFWGIVKYLNALFRGVGQVIFVNNPWSGFVILASLYWASLLVGFATTVAATTAILTAIVFKQEESKITSGITTYCAVLVGSITSSIWEPTYGEPVGPLVWGFIVLAAALSVLVNVAVGNIFGSFKPPIPSFTLAFNIVTILLFTVLQPRNFPANNKGRAVSSSLPNTSTIYDSSDSKLFSIFQIPGVGHGRVKPSEIDVLMLIEGIMLSMGQVYGVQHLKGSVAMYISTLIYSPTVCILSIVGATVGSVFGLVFAGPTFQTVYDGLWGFNPILAAIGVGAFFFVPTSLSFACAVADVALVVLVQMALTVSFTPLQLPFLTFPFVISSLFFTEVTATGDILTRVTKYSYPEKHLREFIANKQQKAAQAPVSMGMTREAHVYPSAPLLPTYYNEDNGQFGYTEVMNYSDAHPSYLNSGRQFPNLPNFYANHNIPDYRQQENLYYPSLPNMETRQNVNTQKVLKSR